MSPGEPEGTAVLPSAQASVSTRVRGFVALTKPRIIELLLVTTVPTMFVAKRGIPSGWLILATLIGGALAAGGANAINMFVDRDIDAIMQRTRNRPLVTGVVKPGEAIVFALALEVVAFAELWAWVNLLSAVLAVSATLFYVFVYTLWLKRTSKQNIVIGGAAGAVPVLVGWSSVTGHLGWAPVVLFALIFVWTPSHFWALAFRYREDYGAAGVPMLPAVASVAQVARQIIIYSILLWAVSVLFGLVAHMGWIYTVVAIAAGAYYVVDALRLRSEKTPASAMRLFKYSITYVTLLFGAMAVDVVVRHP
ncbi:MAG TPA: heme o synthase [Acidimicrobiales bacterium]|nr:heme o synthase [Acidimicrobiales bacterium]